MRSPDRNPWRRLHIAASAVAALLALTACARDVSVTSEPGRSATPTRTAFAGDDLCATLSKVPAIAGDHGVTVAGARQTTLAGLRTWYANVDGPNGPQGDLSHFHDVDTTAPDDSPVEVCVFRSPTDYSIPQPPGADLHANALRVFAQDGHRFGIDAYSQADRLVEGLRTVPG